MFSLRKQTGNKSKGAKSGAIMGHPFKLTLQRLLRYPAVIKYLLGAVIFLAQAGCADPASHGRFRSTPVTNIILDSMMVVDEEPEQFAGARAPEPRDLLVQENEYVIKPGDVIEISIFDLFASGAEWRDQIVIPESGRITLPEIGTFRVVGRTELELTDDIKSLLSPQIIRDPIVNVVILRSGEKIFSISGAVATPSRYPLMEPDLRILEALAMAGGIPQSGVDYAYVVRTVSDEELEAAWREKPSSLFEDWEKEQGIEGQPDAAKAKEGIFEDREVMAPVQPEPRPEYYQRPPTYQAPPTYQTPQGQPVYQAPQGYQSPQGQPAYQGPPTYQAPQGQPAYQGPQSSQRPPAKQLPQVAPAAPGGDKGYFIEPPSSEEKGSKDVMRVPPVPSESPSKPEGTAQPQAPAAKTPWMLPKVKPEAPAPAEAPKSTAPKESPQWTLPEVIPEPPKPAEKPKEPTPKMLPFEKPEIVKPGVEPVKPKPPKEGAAPVSPPAEKQPEPVQKPQAPESPEKSRSATPAEKPKDTEQKLSPQQEREKLLKSILPMSEILHMVEMSYEPEMVSAMVETDAGRGQNWGRQMQSTPMSEAYDVTQDKVIHINNIYYGSINSVNNYAGNGSGTPHEGAESSDSRFYQPSAGPSKGAAPAREGLRFPITPTPLGKAPEAMPRKDIKSGGEEKEPSVNQQPAVQQPSMQQSALQELKSPAPGEAKWIPPWERGKKSSAESEGYREQPEPQRGTPGARMPLTPTGVPGYEAPRSTGGPGYSSAYPNWGYPGASMPTTQQRPSLRYPDKRELEPGKRLQLRRENGVLRLVPVADPEMREQERRVPWNNPEASPVPPAPVPSSSVRPGPHMTSPVSTSSIIPRMSADDKDWKPLDSKNIGKFQEVIRIDLKALQSGDLSQNIVIRPGDYIRVQYNDIGVFYMMGQVSRPGPYSLRGEKMTLKQAISVAGPLSALADMTRCDITRRIDRNKEVTCRVNLQKLLEGSQPDLFIKPNDIINVGSHPLARWVAVIRQSFRSTYGFGFVYDRNLADKDFGN